ncbi:MAG: hypothetical protein EPN38_07685 [Rhodanobacteraceae bacterium]|nr:MAG: hypothetical protein EPN38_07685 [Rhodanobacteraceae bacterium]
MTRAQCVAFSTSILFAVLVSGCAIAPTAETQAKQAELARTTPVCVSDADCKAKWDAAQLWIVHNAGYKLQTVTDVLLSTYNSVGGSPDIAVQVTKEPIGGGKYKILVSVSCDNLFGCVPNQWDAALDFNKTVSAVTP